MKTRRRSDPPMPPVLGALFVILAMLCPLTRTAAEEQRQRSVSPVRQAAPPQTFGTMSPVQSAPLAGHQLYGQQYNPPGLSSASGTHPIQNNPPGLQGAPNPNSPTMALPAGVGSAGSQTSSQGAPGSGGPGPGGPGPAQAGPGAYGSAYPVGYQGPPPVSPPYGYQAPPAYARQFTCRTLHYLCLVPSTGACQCENDRREREPGATVD